MDLRLEDRTKFMVLMKEGGKALCLLSDGPIELVHRTSESVAFAATDRLETRGPHQIHGPNTGRGHSSVPFI